MTKALIIERTISPLAGDVRARRCSIMPTVRIAASIFMLLASVMGRTVFAQPSDSPVAFADVPMTPIVQIPTPQAIIDWQVWLQPAPLRSGSLQLLNRQAERGCRLTGTSRLVPTWNSDTLLRIQLVPQYRFCLHLFHANDGVTLYYNAGRREWSGYVTTRTPGTSEPDSLNLTASDLGRARQSESGGIVPLGLHWSAGELVLSRGRLILLRVPLSGPPTDVFFDGKADLFSIETLSCGDFPAPLSTTRRPQHPPALLEWSPDLAEGSEFQELDNGSVRLSGERTRRMSQVTAMLPAAGPRQFIVQVASITPGTGLFLTDETNSHAAIAIQFVRNRRDGRTCVVATNKRQGLERNWNAFPSSAIPYVNEQLWIRFVFGAGSFRWWISDDGHNWAAAEEPSLTLASHCTRFGLYHLQDAAHCEIELASLQSLPLAELQACCDHKLLLQAAAVRSQWTFGKGIDSWHSAIVPTCPADVALPAWEDACAVALLGTGCDAQLGGKLLAKLLDGSCSKTGPADPKWKLLDEAALLTDSRRMGDSDIGLPERYGQVARDAWQVASTSPWSQAYLRLMSAPLDRHTRIENALAQLMEIEAIDLVYQEDWSALRNLCRKNDYFKIARGGLLLPWADELSASELGVQPVAANQSNTQLLQPPMLGEELQRAVYNQIVELDWLVKARSWQDAARHIANMLSESPRGVAPAPNDTALLYSSPAAVRSAIDRHPELTTQIEQDYGELYRLRVESAIRQRKRELVAQLAEQIPGLRAAQQARQWLGDQYLAQGDFDMALAIYRDLETDGIGNKSDELHVRIGLAAALTGSHQVVEISAPVQIGSESLSPRQLKSLLEDLADHHQSTSVLPPSVRVSQPGESAVQVGRRMPLQLVVGATPEQEVLTGMDKMQVDWPGRQLTARQVDDLLIVHNRFELVVLDAGTGRLIWTSYPLGSQTLRSRDWPLVPMVPLVDHRFVFARHLCEADPEVACWNLATGSLRWSIGLGEQVPVSDPFLLGGQLAVLTTDQQGAVDTQLTMQILDRSTGSITDSLPLLRLRSPWWQTACCQVSVCENQLLVALGGVSFCCDKTGSLRWIRSSRTVPLSVDPRRIHQVHQAPVIVDKWAYFNQVGVAAIEAVNCDTGQLRWRQVLPGLTEIIVANSSRLIAKTLDGFLALDTTTGKLLWRQRDENLLLGTCCDATTLLYAREQISDDREQPDDQQGKRPVQLVQLDLATGQLLGSLTINELAGSAPCLGPILARDDRLWVFFSATRSGGQREMVELRREELEE